MPEFRKWKPFTTLLEKEVRRFWAVASQTLMAPVVTAALYLLIFGVNLGARVELSSQYTYLQFVVPGLVLMGVINNSFANVSSSLFTSRYLGNIVELLVTPLSPAQFIGAYTVAGMIRGLLVGAVIFGVSAFFTELPMVHPLRAFTVLFLGSFLFCQLGFLAALLSKSFDTLSMFTNFLILPLTYLGGLFYPVKDLGEPWKTLSHLNPLYYLIEGFRGATLGTNDLNFSLVLTLIGVLSAAIFAASSMLILKGYNLRN